MRAAVEALEGMLNPIPSPPPDVPGHMWYVDQLKGRRDAADYALSLLRSALEQGEPEPVATDAVWLIHYDDADRRPEIVVGEKGARARFARISDNWNAHLFVKVASNTRDERYRDANIKLASIPPNTPEDALRRAGAAGPLGDVEVASGVKGPDHG